MEIQELANRITRLEQENHRLHRAHRRARSATLALFAFAGAAVLMGQAARDEIQDTIKARSIEIVDDAGHVRVRLGAITRPGSDPAKGLALYSENGTEMAMLANWDAGGGTGLTMNGADGTKQLRVSVEPNAHPAVVLYAMNGREPLAGLTVSAKGEPQFELFRENKPRVGLKLAQESWGYGGLYLMNEAGEEAARLEHGTMTNARGENLGQTRLDLLNSKGKINLQLYQSDDDIASLALANAEGKPRANLQVLGEDRSMYFALHSNGGARNLTIRQPEDAPASIKIETQNDGKSETIWAAPAP